MKASTVLPVTSTTCDLLWRYSSYDKLQRIITRCLRLKTKAIEKKKLGHFSVEDFEQAERIIAKMTQREAFAIEFKALEHNQAVSKNSKLAQLNPFLNSDT